MLKEVSKEDWIKVVAETDDFSMYIDPVFLDSIAHSLKYNIVYFLKYYRDSPVLGFACFTRGNSIKVPTHFIYSGIWRNVGYNTIKFRNYLIESIAELKQVYKVIEFRLAPEFKDIRPFQWANFSYEVNYTYTRSTANLEFELNIRSRIKRAELSGIKCDEDTHFETVWKHQQYDLKRFNFPDELLRKLKEMYFSWWEKGYLSVFTATVDNQVLASSCVLIDPFQSKASNLLFTSANANYNTGVHAGLYNFIFHKLNEKGIKDFDLYGADLRGVADFKSSFNPVLVPHYTVKFHAGKAALREKVRMLRQILIRARGKIF